MQHVSRKWFPTWQYSRRRQTAAQIDFSHVIDEFASVWCARAACPWLDYKKHGLLLRITTISIIEAIIVLCLLIAVLR